MAKRTVQGDRIPAPRATPEQRRKLTTGKGSQRGEPGTIPDADKAIVKELQGRWDYARQQWDPIIEEGRTDIRYRLGKTWDTADLNARVGRLSLEFDQLNQYRNQLVNSIRQQPIAIKITPEGNGANDKTSQLRADRIRQIEYLSNAQEAYTAAFEGAADRSYGYARIVAEWEPKGFKKRLRIKAVPNPDQVLPDPDAQSITGADWKYLFYSYDMSREEFNRDYPDAVFKDYSDLSDTDQQDARDWQGVDRVQVAEYWRVETVQKRLVRVGTPEQYTDVLEDALTDAQRAMPVIAERMADVPEVCWYLTNGVELLAKRGAKTKKNPWPGSRIPFKACYGPIVYTSNDSTSSAAATGSGAGTIARKQILSYIRLARSAQKYYNYLKSSEGERFKMNLLVPYRAYEGSLSPENLLLLQQSVHTPVAVIQSKAKIEGFDGVVPLPEREIAMLDVAGYEVAAEAARRDIQNALGRASISDPRSGNRQVESGVGLKELKITGDQGSYHFVDAYKAMISALGEDLEELLPFYDDTAGEISTRTASGKVKMQPVNYPNGVGPNGQPSVDLSAGTHATTVSTGPSFDSERQEASDFADTLIGNQAIDRILGPQKAQQLLALAIKLKNVGPLGDEMSEIVSPQQENEPQQLKQHLAQATDQLKKQGAVLEEMHGIIQGKTLELQAQQYKTDKDAETRIKIAEIQFASAANVADIKADVSHSLALMTTQLTAVQGLVEAHQAQLDRVHEAQAQLEAQSHATVQAQTPPPVDPNAAPAAPPADTGA